MPVNCNWLVAALYTTCEPCEWKMCHKFVWYSTHSVGIKVSKDVHYARNDWAQCLLLSVRALQRFSNTFSSHRFLGKFFPHNKTGRCPHRILLIVCMLRYYCINPFASRPPYIRSSSLWLNNSTFINATSYICPNLCTCPMYSFAWFDEGLWDNIHLSHDVIHTASALAFWLNHLL